MHEDSEKEYRRINTLRFERSDPNDYVAIDEHGNRITRLEDMRQYPFFRTDIGMVNVAEIHCGSCTCQSTVDAQLMVYASKDGEPWGKGWDSDFLTDDDRAWYREENARLIFTAKTYPEFEKYLRTPVDHDVF